jgi:hypothetical protein
MSGDMTDRQWCLRLRDALSLASIAPSLTVIDEVRVLLASPPPAYLTSEWMTLRHAARLWLERVDESLPRFPGGGALRAAEAALPAPMPDWAAREALVDARRAAIFQDAEGRN